MEPQTPVASKFDGLGNEKKMKTELKVFDFVKPLAAFIVLPLVFYVFSKNQLFASMTQNSNAFPSLEVYEVLILFFVMAFLAVLMIFGNERILSMTFVLLGALLTPSILFFSKLDWFRVLGIQFNVDTVNANLPSYMVSAISLVLVATWIFLLYTSRIDTAKKELLRRGASEIDVEKAMNAQSSFTSKMLLGCFGIAFLIFGAASAVQMILATQAAVIPYAYLMLALIVACALIVCTVIYLRSNAGLQDRQSRNAQNSTENALR